MNVKPPRMTLLKPTVVFNGFQPERQSHWSKMNVQVAPSGLPQSVYKHSPIHHRPDSLRWQLSWNRIPRTRSTVKEHIVFLKRNFLAQPDLVRQNPDLRPSEQVFIHGPGNRWDTEKKSSQSAIHERRSNFQWAVSPCGVIGLQNRRNGTIISASVGYWIRWVHRYRSCVYHLPSRGEFQATRKFLCEPLRKNR